MASVDRVTSADNRAGPPPALGELATDMTMATDGFTAFEHLLPLELEEDAVQFFARSGTYYPPR